MQTDQVYEELKNLKSKFSSQTQIRDKIDSLIERELSPPKIFTRKAVTPRKTPRTVLKSMDVLADDLKAFRQQEEITPLRTTSTSLRRELAESISFEKKSPKHITDSDISIEKNSEEERKEDLIQNVIEEIVNEERVTFEEESRAEKLSLPESLHCNDPVVSQTVMSPPMILQSKSPMKSVLTKDKNVNRLSFANQTPEEKEALEKRKAEFIKKQQEKRRQDNNQAETSVLKKSTIGVVNKCVTNKALDRVEKLYVFGSKFTIQNLLTDLF